MKSAKLPIQNVDMTIMIHVSSSNLQSSYLICTEVYHTVTISISKYKDANSDSFGALHKI